MDDEEDQETPFQEMDAQQLTAKTAWVRLFVREASERGYTIEEIAALLHQPGMTAKKAVGGEFQNRPEFRDFLRS